MNRLIVLIIAVAALIYAFSGDDSHTPRGGELIVTIDGMFCDGCNLKVSELLKTIDGITDIEADYIASEVRFKAAKEINLEALNTVLATQEYLATSFK